MAPLLPPPPPMPATMAVDLPHEVGTVRRAVEKGRSVSAIPRHQVLIGTTRTNNYSCQDNDGCIGLEPEIQLMRQQDDELDDVSASIQRIRGAGLTTHEELSGQDPLLNQKDAHDLNNYPCTPLNEKATIAALKIVSFGALSMIVALSGYSADTLALITVDPIKQVLLISPYVCVTVALLGFALSLCASETNGLADYAAITVILVCLFGIYLGASAAVLIIGARRWSMFLWIEFWTCVFVVGLFCGWGWLFAYPRCLKSMVRILYWSCFDRRRSTVPLRAANADLESARSTDQMGFGKMLSSSLAAFLKAVHPLDENATIDVMKAFSPALLTGMSTLSLWAVHTVSPKAYLARFLYTLPYIYLPVGVIAIALSAGASKSNGLASCASCLVLLLCACGVVLGCCCSSVVLHSGPLSTTLVTITLVSALICAWGWMFAYPKMLNCALHRTVSVCCARRPKIHPGRDEGCGCTSMAWIFGSLKVCSHNVVHFVSRCYGLSFRSARSWWTAGHAACAGGELDLEAGTAAVELTPLAGSCSPEEAEQGVEKDANLRSFG